MGTQPSPSVEKERTRTRISKNPIRDALLKPKTWKTAIIALGFFMKLTRLVAKIWDLFG